MGRGKVEMKRIENKINRQVTFSKRRGGLFKKAHEISVLCDAEVALIVFSHKDKLFEYATDSCMDSILEKYERYSFAERQLVSNTEPDSPENWIIECSRLKARIDLLQRNHMHYMGQQLDSMSLKDLQNLEQQLDTSLRSVRLRKNQLLHDSISELQRKEKKIQEQNSMLSKKIKEKEKEMGQQTQWHQQSHHTTNGPPLPMPPPFLMAPQSLCLDIRGGSYEHVTDARRNELDLNLDTLYSCHLGCFAA